MRMLRSQCARVRDSPSDGVTEGARWRRWRWTRSPGRSSLESSCFGAREVVFRTSWWVVLTTGLLADFRDATRPVALTSCRIGFGTGGGLKRRGGRLVE